MFDLRVGSAPLHDTDAPMAILMRQINEEIPAISALVPDVDPTLSDWVARLLEKDPAQRTRSAAVAARELEDILIEQLGSRWLRDAGLPESSGGPGAPLAGTPERVASAAAAPIRDRAVTPETTAMDDPGATRRSPDRGAHGDGELAATVAPLTLRADSRPARHVRRRPGAAPGPRTAGGRDRGLIVVLATAVTRGDGHCRAGFRTAGYGKPYMRSVSGLPYIRPARPVR